MPGFILICQNILKPGLYWGGGRGGTASPLASKIWPASPLERTEGNAGGRCQYPNLVAIVYFFVKISPKNCVKEKKNCLRRELWRPFWNSERRRFPPPPLTNTQTNHHAKLGTALGQGTDNSNPFQISFLCPLIWTDQNDLEWPGMEKVKFSNLSQDGVLVDLF